MPLIRNSGHARKFAGRQKQSDNSSEKICWECFKDVSQKDKVLTQASSFESHEMCYWCNKSFPTGTEAFLWLNPKPKEKRSEKSIDDLIEYLKGIDDPYDVVMPFESSGDTQTLWNERDILLEIGKFKPEELSASQKLKVFDSYQWFFHDNQRALSTMDLDY